MEKTFKVIIIGGGPVGLTAAHALHHAGIDFIVLEGRSAIVEDKGASLVVYPHTFRVMHQFDLLEALLSVGGELNHHLSFTSDGHVFNEGARYERIRENHGHGPVVLHRAEVIEILYKGLPATTKSNILTNKKLVDIVSHKNGVDVICADGSTYHGSILIGADGVHSKTRNLMRDIALDEDPSRAWDPVQPFTSSYQLLYGAFPAPSSSGQGYDVQAKGKAIMYLSGPKRAWFFLYKKLPRPTTERRQYSEDDIETLAQEFAGFPLTQTVKVKDVWPHMLGAGMTNLEEGIAQHWYLGRIVLVGDACHKMTTHLGHGFNNGVQDIIVLCNELRRAVQMPPSKNPDISTLTEVFEAYEKTRKSRACSLVADVANAGLETRMHAWENICYYGLSRYLSTPRCVESVAVNWLISPELRKGRVLEYIPMEEVMRGRMSWVYPMNE
ncbi:FAD/NAD(P)-binding domain-containing protein [Aspergillus sclerotioniger CBS 115572]|uniref:FAD/NAD(P)-binding domain-containing protein n=1 Tax=Aspergillus sclerotioniger CBS 115572 TaxID=1450535 RepID=A0A317V6E8_9EURO|nr:FAD/NAD(P)-binding domain-containing protein [Aspergillus sclerotioniger CBS 115572]PWY69605.1 FAD/NAD(P)-binding domain-containing protein [Aspergillus sclerotioniger CBS 115572]